jgi:hypothetical protein
MIQLLSLGKSNDYQDNGLYLIPSERGYIKKQLNEENADIENEDKVYIEI